MAFYTLDGIATHPKVELACVADVDSSLLGKLKAKYPDAKIYQDWRQMLAHERHHIDLACVGTPDHMHAPIAVKVMNLNLPVYVQKPLAHNLFEVRTMTDLARRSHLVTQMGIQVHSRKEYRAAVKLIQDGAIGKVREVHSWSNKKWGDEDLIPDRADPIPETLNWNLWLGVAAKRPYVKDIYHPVNWRKRIDFGTATFGDIPEQESRVRSQSCAEDYHLTCNKNLHRAIMPVAAGHSRLCDQQSVLRVHLARPTDENATIPGRSDTLGHRLPARSQLAEGLHLRYWLPLKFLASRYRYHSLHQDIHPTPQARLRQDPVKLSSYRYSSISSLFKPLEHSAKGLPSQMFHALFQARSAANRFPLADSKWRSA